MAHSTQSAGRKALDTSKSAEMVKAAEGLWAALLAGSASPMVERAATPAAKG